MKSITFFKTSAIAIFLLLSLSSTSHAWGKRGHALVAESAAYLVGESKPLFKSQSFNLAYYANVPDIVWKGIKDVYPVESPEHFMDMEIFERTMTEKGAWNQDRKAFFQKNSSVPHDAGRAFWRIAELDEKIGILETQLKSENDDKKKRELQAQWFEVAGILGHYVADLAQPLHVTENYDGQLTDQKGVHEFFESQIVDDVYPEISARVFRRALELRPKLSKAFKDKSAFELSKLLATDSNKFVADILKVDKATKREAKKAAPKLRKLIIERLAIGSVYLAEIWSRRSGFNPVTEKFWSFNPRPDFIVPAEVK